MTRWASTFEQLQMALDTIRIEEISSIQIFNQIHSHLAHSFQYSHPGWELIQLIDVFLRSVSQYSNKIKKTVEQVKFHYFQIGKWINYKFQILKMVSYRKTLNP